LFTSESLTGREANLDLEKKSEGQGARVRMSQSFSSRARWTAIERGGGSTVDTGCYCYKDLDTVSVDVFMAMDPCRRM